MLDGYPGNTERIHRAVAFMDVKHAGRTLNVTVSIGVAEMREPEMDWEVAVNSADTALYEAKKKAVATKLSAIC